MDPVEGVRQEEEWSGRDRELMVAIGARLRSTRLRRGWSLRRTAEVSGGEFKWTAVANYERGERMISVPRLVRLAQLYRTTVAELLGEATTGTPAIDLTAAGGDPSIPDPSQNLVIDVTALGEAERSPDMQVLWRYVRSVRTQRADSGSVCTLRAADLSWLGRALGRSPASIREELGPAVANRARPAGRE